MFTHSVAAAANELCRKAADTGILSIDGQYSSMLDTLYQLKFGMSGGDMEVHSTDLRVILTVTSPDGVLQVGAYTHESDIQNQVDALLTACGDKGPRSTKLIASDNPEVLDHGSVRTVFRRAVISGDPLHLALNVEKVSSGHKTAVSKCLRACVVKLRQGLDDGKPYVRSTSTLPQHPDIVKVKTKNEFSDGGPAC